MVDIALFRWYDSDIVDMATYTFQNYLLFPLSLLDSSCINI